MAEPVFWFDVRDEKRRRWPFYLSNQTISPELRDGKVRYYGVTLYAQRRVLIDAGQPKRDLYDTAFHELGHISLAYLNLAPELEEIVIQKLSPRLSPLLKRLKMEFPPLPPEYHSLRKRVA